ELIQALRRTIQNYMDIVVARFPGIAKHFASFVFEWRCNRVSKPVQRLSQGSAPFLIPIRISAGIAATVAVPALDSVRATPCTPLPDFSFMSRRMTFEILAIIGQFRQAIAFDVL